MFGMKLFVFLAATAFLATDARVVRQQEKVPWEVDCDTESNTLLDYSTDNSVVTLKSNVGERYSNNQRCTLATFSDHARELVFNFKEFEVEYNSNNCSWDALCFNGNLYCGSELAGGVITVRVPANKEFSLGFKTDGSVTYKGFVVEVTENPIEDYTDDDYVDTCYTFTSSFPDYYNWNSYTDYPIYGTVDDSYATGDYEYATGDYEHGSGDYEYYPENPPCNTDNEYATGDYEYATGDYEYATGDYEYATGDYEYATGDYEYATGDYEYSTGDYEYATGDYEYATGEPVYATGG